VDIPAAGAVIFDNYCQLLLVKRGRAPAFGRWSIPGGKCDPGETPSQACVREAAEETGLVVEVVRFAGRVIRDAPDGNTFVIDDYVCKMLGGQLRAADDAAAAGWFSLAGLSRVPLVDGLYATLAEWGLLPD
jgi:8-oxo-dGTP diphosphatase